MIFDSSCLFVFLLGLACRVGAMGVDFLFCALLFLVDFSCVVVVVVIPYAVCVGTYLSIHC